MSAQSETLASPPTLWVTAMPGLFVLLWGSGFVGAKLGMPYAEPLTFLFIRYAVLIVILAGVVAVFRAPWPKTGAELARTAWVGFLVHGVYLGGVFSAIAVGMPAGITALIVGLQPLLTALGAGPILGERITARQWLGLALGLLGVVLVLAEKLDFERAGVLGVVLCVVSLVAITYGTLYQKRHGGGNDLRTASLIHFIAAAIPTGLLALVLETRAVVWSGEFIFALGWLVVVLSLGAISLLWLLVKNGAASKVASLFYLVPPVTAVFAWMLFGETLGALAVAGMGVTVTGVALVTKRT